MTSCPHPRSAKWLFELGAALVTAGVVVLLFVAYELLGTNFAEQASQAQLAKQFKAEVSKAAAAASAPVPQAPRRAHRPSGASQPSGAAQPDGSGGTKPWQQNEQGPPLYVAPPVPPVGGALDHMVIPAIGLDRYVVQGVGAAELQMGPGHYPGTPLPGEPGNVAIAGHRTTFGAPFFRLNELKRGDYVYLTDTRGTTWAYKVTSQWVVAPTDVAVVAPTAGAELTLTTCNPRFWATSRLVVRAVLAGVIPRGAKILGALPLRGALHLAPVRGALRLPPAAVVAKVEAGRGRKEERREAASVRGGAAKPKVHGEAGGAPLASSGPGPASRAASSAGQPTVGAKPTSLALPASDGWSTDAALAAWGALAVASWVGTRLLASRQRRWAKFGLLLGGALVTAVPLWFAFGEVVKLLPANY
jgi:LPXTG-site transpeptidase (sortase) family protein